MERRLAAILAADVVGYSRLMGQNEAGTLAALKAHRRELIDREISSRGGRIINAKGDGVLVEFASVVAAVECAAAIQVGVADRNRGVPPDERIEFRIGVNLDEVIGAFLRTRQLDRVLALAPALRRVDAHALVADFRSDQARPRLSG